VKPKAASSAGDRVVANGQGPPVQRGLDQGGAEALPGGREHHASQAA
jgi:hypothetical protein